jgi:hypothetical protein
MVLIATNAGAILRHSDSGDGAFFSKNWYRRAVVGSMGKDGAPTTLIVETHIRNEVRSFHSPKTV